MDSTDLATTCACLASDPTCVDGDIGEKTCVIYKTGTQCPAGTYLTRTGAKAVSECKICPLGSYCPTLMACAVILDSDNAVTTLSTCASSGMSATCPSGSTCYYGTQHYESCPIGTYGKFDMLENATGSGRICEVCPGGYTCATTGMTVPTPCTKGFYSADGSSAATCAQCTLGNYCEREDTSEDMMNANTCLAGYECPIETPERPFYDHEDQWGISDKYSCPLGNYCTGGVPT